MNAKFAAALVLAVAAAIPAAAEHPPFALVELYTSEGCSSCPPADRLLGELAAEHREGVVVVAFHVDFWDYLGWRDRFASPEFSDRLRAYGRLGDGRVFTPEIVVNGRWALVGSDESRVRDAVARGLAEPASARLALDVAPGRSSDELTVRPLTADAPATTLVSVAVVEDGLVTPVRRGENANRQLRHERVVRAFDEAPLRSATGSGLRLRLPDDLNRTKAEIVAWLSREPGGPVLAVAAAPMP